MKNIFFVILLFLIFLSSAAVSAENIGSDLAVSDEYFENIIQSDLVSAVESTDADEKLQENSSSEGAVGDSSSEGAVGDSSSEGAVGDSSSESNVENSSSEGAVGDSSSEFNVENSSSEGAVGDSSSEGTVENSTSVLTTGDLTSSEEIYIIAPKKFVIGHHNLRISLPLGAEGAVTILVDGKLYKKVSSKDYFRDWDMFLNDDYEEEFYEVECSVYTDLLGLKAGKHTIKAIFSGDSRYGTLTAQKTIAVDYLLSIDVKGPYIYGRDTNKENSKIRIALPKDIKNKPIVKIDGKTYNLKGVKKFYDFYVNTHRLAVGTHTIKVSYKECGKYPSKSLSKKFIVQYGIYSNFNQNEYVSDLYYGEGNLFSLKLPSNAKGRLSVYLSKNEDKIGKLYKSIPLKKGIAKIPLDNLKIGRYFAHVVYTGKDYKVKAVDCGIYMGEKLTYPAVMTYGQNLYLTLRSHKSDNRQLKVYLDEDKFYGTIKLVNGLGRISLKKMPIGEYNYLDIYAPGDWINSPRIDVLPFVGAKNINTYYGNAYNYAVKVLDDNAHAVGKDKQVVFNIAGKTYKVKTNSKGIASIKITAKPGTYRLTIAYNNYVLVKKVVVRHVLSLAKVNVKKSQNRLVLAATLKQGKKLLIGKNVTFTFYGKKYAAKTNKNGIAKVLINKSVLNKLKVGQKLTYYASYLQDTVKRTVKVQK